MIAGLLGKMHPREDKTAPCTARMASLVQDLNREELAVGMEERSDQQAPAGSELLEKLGSPCCCSKGHVLEGTDCNAVGLPSANGL